MEQDSRVALITGVGSGLGRHIALALAVEGWTIAGVDLKEEGLSTLSTELAEKPCAWRVADVTDREAVREAVKELQEKLGPVELLVASAGIGRETPANAFRADDFEAVIRVNLIGVANCVEAVLPSMLRQRKGHLVAISSLASYRGLPLMAGYCASKSGVNALMDSLRVELKTRGIAVTTICPGWIRTAMTADLRIPMPHILEADEAARLIVAAIKKKKTFYAFPRPLARHVSLLRWLPRSISDWLLRRALDREFAQALRG